MAMRTAKTCLATTLFVIPVIAHAATARDANVGIRNAAVPLTLSPTRYELVSGSTSDEIVVAGLRARKFAPQSRRSREADGARFGDGEIQYIEGPAWDYRISGRGPMFEVAALGGGIENAPYLAHVAMNWRF